MEEEYSSSKASGEQPPASEGHHEHPPASTTGLMASAKDLMGSVQSAFSGKTDEIDKGRAAGEAEDLLGAAQEYGKLGSTGVGQYVDKAEGYLHSYHTSNSQQPEGEGKAPVSERREEEEEEKEETGLGGAGVGDYISKAKGFFN